MMVFRITGRLLARFFGKLGRITIGGFKFVGRHEMFLGGTVVVGLVVGGIWLLLSVLNINIVVGEPQPVVKAVANAATPTPAATATPRVTTNNAPQSTETFMRGQLYFNADDVWDSLDAQFHNQLASNGRDKTYFARRLQQLKDSGIKYESYRYVGGYDGANGQTIHFYVARYTDTDKTVKDEPFTFVVASQGKIVAFS